VLMSIGEVAEELGVSASALRYYEAEGLVPPAVRVSGKRVYSEGDVNLFRFLLLGREIGFGMAELKAMKTHFQTRDGESRTRMLEILLDQIEEQMAQLKAKRAMLLSAQECSCSSPKTCSELQQLRGEHP